MIYRLVVPGPIEDVEEVRVLEWHRTEGQSIETDQLLVELETHKAVVEVRPLRPACLRRVFCNAGSWLKIGGSLALLSDTADEPLPAGNGDLAILPVGFELT